MCMIDTACQMLSDKTDLLHVHPCPHRRLSHLAMPYKQNLPGVL